MITFFIDKFRNGFVSFKECGEPLKLMKNRKSPGSDGFTVDFYKFFWKDIGAFVFRSLYFGYETGHFSQFQTQGVITKLKLSKALRKNFHSIESKAFSKSTNNNKPSI
jgi:hypothetical protein